MVTLPETAMDPKMMLWKKTFLSTIEDFYESWVVPAGVPSALADIGGGVEANY